MNFKHLHYFWMTAKAGGIVRAGEQLHTTPQTLSAQIKLLEDWLGRRLFRKKGRQLELTNEGRVALDYAEQIFTLGGELEAALRLQRGERRPLEFRVGLADSVAKNVAYHLLEPALDVPGESVRMTVSEGKFVDLLGQLALHRLDLVLADEQLNRRISVQAYNHHLGNSGVSFLATPALRAQLQGPFPDCLDGAPMLIPGPASSLRQQLDGWLTRRGLRPRVVAEFDDGALMAAFGRQGRGVFLAPTQLEIEMVAQSGVELVGSSPELREDFYAISVERRISHPCVAAITQAARRRLLGS